MEHGMHDMGEMRDMGEAPTQEGKKEKYFPSISLTTEQLPELEGKGIGSKISLHIMSKIRGIREDKDKTSYEIELRECGMMSKMSEEEYMSKSDDEKDAHDAEEMKSKMEKHEE